MACISPPCVCALQVIVVKREDRFRLGLWVNREVRAKKKLVDFGEAAMSIDVPKQLGQAFVAVSALSHS